jgi:HNH endonuclease
MPRTKFAQGQRAKTMYQRVMERTERQGDCLIFTGALAKGYGRIRNYDTGGVEQAHRVVYEVEVAPIPEGLTIDHVQERCTSRACVEVGHMEVVTRAENTRRAANTNSRVLANRAKTHCPKGHPYSEANTYTPPGGGRFCRTCIAAKTKAWRERNLERERAKARERSRN